MTRGSLVSAVLDGHAPEQAKTTTRLAVGLAIAGAIGLGLGFVGVGDPGAGWAGLLTATVLVIGLAAVGPLLSAIFQMTGAKWGRVYLRLAEGSVVLMPVGLIALVALMAGGNAYLPWVHEHPHVGGKAIWLTRGFWDARVLGLLIAVYAVGLAQVRLSVRRDYCLKEVRDRITGRIAGFFSRGITNANAEAEKARCTKNLAVLSPIVVIVYGACFSMLGIDLIMALEPDWFSTLFGAWYFIGNVFFGLALLAIGSAAYVRKTGLSRFFTPARQGDMATLLLAFCLINVDFFWNQYLTIWYANLPEETFYLIERTVDQTLPWRYLSFVSLAAFFLIPFLALLIRKVKIHPLILSAISLIAIVGVLLARFIEIAPPLLRDGPLSGNSAVVGPLAATALILLGLLGAGLLLYKKWLVAVPVMPVNDDVFIREFTEEAGP
ncbi:MAG: hypothetical protein QNJ97_25480 [Myxococcota bacterium]|nr:hypothetical protein [Myxococcota bacterium]